MPVLTVSRNSSPSLSTTGIFAPVHTSPKIAPEAAGESIGWEKSMQAGCLPIEQAVQRTMPPVVHRRGENVNKSSALSPERGRRASHP